MRVASEGYVKVACTKITRTVAHKNQPVPVRSDEGAMVVSRGIDCCSQVLRRTPRIIHTRTLRDIDVKAAKTSWAIGCEVKTQTSLCDEGSTFERTCVDRGSQVNGRRPSGKILRVHLQPTCRQQRQEDGKPNNSYHLCLHVWPPLSCLSNMAKSIRDRAQQGLGEEPRPSVANKKWSPTSQGVLHFLEWNCSSERRMSRSLGPKRIISR